MNPRMLMKNFLEWYCKRHVSIGDIVLMVDLVNEFLEEYYQK